MAEEGGATSIAARIAALNLKQVGQAAAPAPPRPNHIPTTNATKPQSPAPSLPQRRPGLPSSISASTVAAHGTGNHEIGNLPAAPPPTVHGGKPAPALPPRRPTDHGPALPTQRPSEAPSLASQRPPPPPKRGKEEPTTPVLNSSKSSPSLPQRPALPQRPGLPSRPSDNDRKLEPPPPRKSALSQGFGFQEKAPSIPSKRPVADPPTLNPSRTGSDATGVEPTSPPPIPTSSRPDLTSLKASKPKPGATVPPSATGVQKGVCLLCRDFSAVDAHAARFPRQSIPSHDPAWLAHQLTSPFPSPTDKARAIFTWLHHNVAYNTAAFFSGNLKASTPASTLTSGLAVCEGYAALFTCLASHAGLQSRVIGGHGKGYGYAALAPGSAIPPYESGHAWNVVQIDGGEWKLLDACWGAGTVDGASQAYTRRFNPSQFTRSNADFGRSHFPEDRRSFYRDDARCPTWAQYLLNDGDGDGPRRFDGYTHQEGVSEASLEPRRGQISVLEERRKGSTRFSFTKVCPHWNNEVMGKGTHYCYILSIGIGGTEKRVPFETNGWAWWADVKAEDLGWPGEKVQICALTSFDGKDGRGVTASEFNAKVGRVGMGWSGVAEWELVA